MTETATLIAARGARFLDKKIPGWATAIHLGRLDIADPDDCIIGQLYGDYNVGVGQLFPSLALTRLSPYQYGFDAPTLKNCADLNDAWAVEIHKRTQESPAVKPDRELVLV